MPRFNGTGPSGEGKMTGYGRGYCTVSLEDLKSTVINQQINSDSPRPYRRNFLRRRYNQRGYAFGRGNGFRRGRRNMYRLTDLPIKKHSADNADKDSNNNELE